MSLREIKKRETWRTIRAVALRLFEQHGYEAVGVEQIAAEAHVSRATFFNYFGSKEAVIFDRDPEQRERWLASMQVRPAGESPWRAAAAVVLEFTKDSADSLPLQRSLKLASPQLAQSSQDVSNQFLDDLRAWLLDRVEDQERATLVFNVVMAAASSVYQTWPVDEPLPTYLSRLEQTLERVATGMQDV